MGLHLPAAAPYVAEALAHAREDVSPLTAHHGYWPLGLPALRKAIASHLTRSGVPSRPDEILITHGAQEAIALAAALFLGPGRTVFLEDPTYVGALDVFAAAGARLVSFPVGELGIRLDLLREALTHEAPSLIYLMPTFQNPTGVVMPESHRREIARMSAERGVPILEDDALANLDLGQRPPPPISSFAPSAPILSVGSLSKLMWGGLRAGWIRAPEPLIARLARRKALGDLGNSVVSQTLAARLLPRAEEIRESRRRQIAERLAVMEEEMARLLPDWTWRRPGGGLSLWVRLPRGNAAEFARVALRHGVSVLPGATCSPSNGCSEFLRDSLRARAGEDPRRHPPAGAGMERLCAGRAQGARRPGSARLSEDPGEIPAIEARVSCRPRSRRRRFLRDPSLRSGARRHGGVLRPLRDSSRGERQHDRRRDEERAEAIRRVPRPGDDAARRQPCRAEAPGRPEALLRVRRGDRALTGMMMGGVTVFGLPPDLPVYIDAAVMRAPTVVVGGGSRSCKIRVAPEVLRRIPNAVVVEGPRL